MVLFTGIPRGGAREHCPKARPQNRCCLEAPHSDPAKMAKLLDMVRNSPGVKKRMGGYSLMEAESRDPFVQGITFHAHFVGSCEVGIF